MTSTPQDPGLEVGQVEPHDTAGTVPDWYDCPDCGGEGCTYCGGTGGFSRAQERAMRWMRAKSDLEQAAWAAYRASQADGIWNTDGTLDALIEAAIDYGDAGTACGFTC